MKRNGPILSGIVLILLGLLIILTKFHTFRNPNSFLILVGGLFMAAYFYNKAYGFLIPGCLLLGIALSSGQNFFSLFPEDGTWGLGLGFIAIFVIDYIYRGKSHWWPLIPGLILFIRGVRGVSLILSRGWPVVIILLGIFIIFKSLNKKDVDRFEPPHREPNDNDEEV